MNVPAHTWIIAVCAGGIGILIGYLIKYKMMLQLLAGYDEEKVTDKKGLARFMGHGAFFIGILVMLLPLGMTLIGNFAGVIFVGILIISVVYLLIGSRKYQK